MSTHRDDKMHQRMTEAHRKNDEMVAKWKYVIRMPPVADTTFAWERSGVRHVVTFGNRAITLCGIPAADDWRFAGFANCGAGVTCDQCRKVIQDRL